MVGTARALWLSMPWFDATGRLSLLKLGVFVLTCIPGLWMLDEFSSGRWDFPSPYVNLIYHSGLWCTYLLLACLAVSPMRRVTGWGSFAGSWELRALPTASCTSLPGSAFASGTGRPWARNWQAAPPCW